MTWVAILAPLFGAYLLGSIPFGLIVSKVTAGIDPRAHGSGNIGCTNVLRVVGKKAAVYTLVGDGGKGLVAVMLCPHLFPGPDAPSWIPLAVALAAVIGHCYSVFLRFRGGKGVATAFGAVFGIDPVSGVILLGIWGTVIAVWKMSAMGALVAFGMLPVVMGFRQFNVASVVFALTLTALIVIRHQENIYRIMTGRELGLSTPSDSGKAEGPAAH